MKLVRALEDSVRKCHDYLRVGKYTNTVKISWTALQFRPWVYQKVPARE